MYLVIAVLNLFRSQSTFIGSLLRIGFRLLHHSLTHYINDGLGLCADTREVVCSTILCVGVGLKCGKQRGAGELEVAGRCRHSAEVCEELLLLIGHLSCSLAVGTEVADVSAVVDQRADGRVINVLNCDGVNSFAVALEPDLAGLFVLLRYKAACLRQRGEAELLNSVVDIAHCSSYRALGVGNNGCVGHISFGRAHLCRSLTLCRDSITRAGSFCFTLRSGFESAQQLIRQSFHCTLKLDFVLGEFVAEDGVNEIADSTYETGSDTGLYTCHTGEGVGALECDAHPVAGNLFFNVIVIEHLGQLIFGVLLSGARVFLINKEVVVQLAGLFYFSVEAFYLALKFSAEHTALGHIFIGIYNFIDCVMACFICGLTGE